MTETKIRLIGVATVLGAFLIAYLSIYVPLSQAKAGATELNFSMKGTFLTPVTFVYGALTAVSGRRGRALLQTGPGGVRKFTVVGWVLLAASVAAGIALCHWLSTALAAYGYRT